MRFQPLRRDIIDTMEGEHAASGLLVTLLNLFNVDGGLSLSKGEFAAGAEALGYEISDGRWASLCKRFAVTGDLNDELDLSLLGERFRSLYDPLLEALLRQSLRGLIFQSARISKLEVALDNVLNASTRDRDTKLARALHKMTHGLLGRALEGWKRVAKGSAELRGRMARRWHYRYLSSAWQRWREAVDEAQSGRQRLPNALGMLRHRLAAMAFGAWVALWDSAKQQWATAARALSRMLQQQLAMAFSGWCEAVATARWQRQALGRVSARLQHREVAQAFDAWWAAVLEARRQR